jgi:hypothetical protein
MSSSKPSDHRPIDLDLDVTTTAEDVVVLRKLRHETPSWLDLSADDIDALIPAGALERRPSTPAGRPPFSLE